MMSNYFINSIGRMLNQDLQSNPNIKIATMD